MAPVQGEWVQVWGQVADEQRVHPEDLLVRFESHSSDYTCHVRRDRVVQVETAPDFAPICTRLKQVDVAGVLALVRCERVHGHAKKHRNSNADIKWDDSETSGYFEES